MGTDKKQSETITIELRLDDSLDHFHAIKDKFISALAQVLNISAEEIEVLSLREGCVIVVLRVPKEAEDMVHKELMQELQSEQWKKFASNFKVEKSFADIIIDSPYINTQVQLKNIKRGVTWLHLSDIHLRSAAGGEKWMQDQVTDQFLIDLPTLLSEWQLAPDFLFVTGDISFSADASQFTAAVELIRSIRATLKLQPKLFLVPGNHDVSWPNVIPEIEARLRKSLNNPPSVAKHLLDSGTEADRVSSGLRLTNYRTFAQSCEVFGQPTSNHEYFFTDHFNHSGVTVGVAGLNSAWRSTRKDNLKKEPLNSDEGYLILGEPQIITALNDLNKAQLKIALMHHPPESNWFKEFDVRFQKVKLSDFDFLLRGHEHYYSGTVVSPLGGLPSIRIPAGALYSHDVYPKAFNAVRLDFDEGKGYVFLWRYFEDSYHWRKDTGQPNAPHGFVPFQLHPEIRKRLEATTTA